MKRKFTSVLLLFALSFAACIKTEIPIPPPSGGSTTPPTGNIPYDFSMYVNGMFSTYNNGTVDTSDNSFNYIAYGDSACCKIMFLAFNLTRADLSPLTVGIYPASGYDLENQSEWTIYNYGNWNFNSDVGFEAFPDTVTITNITDSTISGTFDGTCTGEILNMNTMNYYDSVQYVTNGKFNLKKW